MDTIYVMDSKTREKADTAKILSIVAVVISGIYVFEGLFSVILSLIPIPIIGFFISVILSVVEFCLLVASVIFVILSLVKASKIKKELEMIADCPELKLAVSSAKLASVLSYVAAGITAVGFCVLSVLNVIEFIMSFI